MEKMNGKIFLKDTRFQSITVAEKFTFDQNKISKRFLQIAFLLALEGNVCVYVCVYLYIIYCKSFTTKLSFPFVQLDYVGGCLFFRKWQSQ